MNDRYSIVKVMSLILYNLFGVFCCVFSIFHFLLNGGVPGFLLELLIWIGGLLLLLNIKGDKVWKRNLYLILHAILMMQMAVGLAIAFESMYVMLVMACAEWALCLFYMNKWICRFVLVLQCYFLVVLTITGGGLQNGMNPLELFTALMAYLFVDWIAVNLSNYVENQNRQNAEQQQTQDDLLKIADMMCDEARIAAKSKSDFLSNMSHEIRTPINSVLGMNEMILRESHDKAILEYASHIESSGSLLLSIINDILDFSKIESGKMNLIDVNYQLSSVLNDLVNMIMPRLEKKGLNLEINADQNVPENLIGDEVRIRQIITNILTNAVKYTDEGTITIDISFVEKEDEDIDLIFAVTDTGKGIREEDKAKLFESFQRIDEKRNRNIEGTGLGLAITSHFVNMMQGQITVDSVYGEGSTFTVILPQKKIDDKPMGDFKKQFEESLKNREVYRESFRAPDARVLVVDDNAVNLTVVRLLLKQTGIQIDCVEGGEEALTALKINKYNVIFLDHMMPGMDGVETLQEIRKRCLAPDVPVIALTANAVSGAREMYLDYGFQDYLSKPIIGKNLEKMLLNYIPEDLIILTDPDEPRERLGSVYETSSESLEVSGGSDAAAYAEDTSTNESPADGGSAASEGESLIDMATAMEFCCDDNDMFREIAEVYLGQYDENVSKISETLEQRDLENYRITVHALKSTSLSVGGTLLSERAKELEFAARDGLVDDIVEKTPALLDLYERTKDELNSKL